jgi:hypothetical protein
MRTSAEYSDGYGHRRVQNALVDALRQAGLPIATSPRDWYGIRDNRRQVAGMHTPIPPRPGARPSFNIPDVSYVARSGRRVNIEIDTDPAANADHLRRLIAADPRAIHIGYVADRLGNITERRVYNPRTGRIIAQPIRSPADLRRRTRLPPPLVRPVRRPQPVPPLPPFVAARPVARRAAQTQRRLR